MSKMSDMAMTIEELRNAAAAINDAADWLSRQFSGESEETEPTPVKEPELKLEDVRAVLADMSRKGPRQRFVPCFRSTVPPSSPALIRRTTAHS